jgi:hypothetical protein
MERERVEALFDRIAQFRDRILETAGPDVQQWIAKTSEGVAHKVMLSGIKGFDVVGDDVASGLRLAVEPKGSTQDVRNVFG